MAGSKKAAAGAPPKPRSLKKATLVHFTYDPQSKRVSAAVQQDVTLAGESQRAGRDVALAIEDLPAGVQKALETAFAGIAQQCKVAT